MRKNVYKNLDVLYNINAIKSMQDEEKRYAEELQSKFHICHIIISHECSGEQFEEKLKEMEGVFMLI